MAKIITSEIPEFPGTIAIKDFISIDMVERYLAARGMRPGHDRNVELFESMSAWVDEWNIENQPKGKELHWLQFRGTPYAPARALITLLENEIKFQVTGITTVPNGLGSESTDTPMTLTEIQSQPS